MRVIIRYDSLLEIDFSCVREAEAFRHASLAPELKFVSLDSASTQTLVMYRFAASLWRDRMTSSWSLRPFDWSSRILAYILCPHVAETKSKYRHENEQHGHDSRD